jgi:predicted RNase H-like HicB family nuclease
MPPHEFGWFGAGYAVAKGGTAPDDYYPPLNDMQAQREWLGGFGAGWVECSDGDFDVMLSTLLGDGSVGESIDDALARALEGRADLLRQLRAHGEGRAPRTLH